MGKRTGFNLGDSAQPLIGPATMPPQPLVFGHHPLSQTAVQITQCRVQGRLVEPAVVGDPSPYHGVEHPGQIIHLLVDTTPELPVPDSLSDGLRRHVADGGCEVVRIDFPPDNVQRTFTSGDHAHAGHTQSHKLGRIFRSLRSL